jgi:hypothetical protein
MNWLHKTNAVSGRRPDEYPEGHYPEGWQARRNEDSKEILININ